MRVSIIISKLCYLDCYLEYDRASNFQSKSDRMNFVQVKRFFKEIYCHIVLKGEL